METVPVSTAQPWYDVRRAEPGIFIIEEPFHYEHVKSYLVEGDERALLLDTGTGAGDLRALVESLTDRPVFLVNSHAHWDHIGCNRQFDERWIHEAEADAATLVDGVGNERLRHAFAPEGLTGPLPEGFDVETFVIPPAVPTGVMEDGHHFDLGGRGLEVLHCPGHSPGGIALLDRANGALFSTDVAYAGALYVYEPANLLTYQASLQRLADLAPTLHAVYPAHDASPIEPAMLPGMAQGVRDAMDGMEPSSRAGDMARYEFDGFVLQVWGMPEPA
ncbi:MAG TPA: MBL fold metallo-hydrolase [Thermomicrobiales bacterium]|nr:MBL fold metallo-hydrolase [Thermomicrobiales bacterium]